MAWHRSPDIPAREGRAWASEHDAHLKVEQHPSPDNTSNATGGLTFASAVLPALLVASVSLVALVSVACLVHRRRLRRRLWDLDEQGSYERLASTKQAPLTRDGAPSLEDVGGLKATSCRRGIRRSTDPVFYGCLAQDRPIDFVVPTLLGSSQAGSIASLVSSSDANSSPMDAVSATAGQPCPSPGEPLPMPCIPTSLLGGLNPELYRVSSGDGGPDDGEDRSFPESHRGRLWFALHYEDSRESLELRVLKARNLPSRVCGSVNCCDPFVRIQLLPDERRYQQTKFKKKTCNPVFDESYIFQIPGKALSERVLKLTVLDNDRGKRHNVIGHVLFPLKDLDPLSGERVVAWRDLEAKPDVATPEQCELLLALCYKATHERLTVTVLEARGLSTPPEIGPPEAPLDTQVKVSFLMENKPVKSKKTSVCKRNCEPKFMESFGFKVSPAGLSAASVILKLSCVAPPHKDRCLGRVVLGSFMFARGQAQQHWTDALAAAPKQIHRWHKLS